MNEYSYRPQAKPGASWPLIAVGAATFVVGAVGAFSFATWQANQKAEIARLEMQLAQMQAAPVEPQATRAATPDLTDIAAIAAVAADIAAAEPGQQNIEGLEDRVAAARALAARIKMERLAEGEVVARLQQEVLDGNYSVEAQSIDDETIGVSLQSENYANTAGLLADILAESANSGDIEVPDYIAVSESGEVDASTLLFDLVQRSLQDGSEDEVAAAAEMSQRTVEAFQAVASNNAAEQPSVEAETAGPRYYTVENGDNLAYISLQVYGRTDAFAAIYAANDDILTNPNHIQVGQRLLIPDI